MTDNTTAQRWNQRYSEQAVEADHRLTLSALQPVDVLDQFRYLLPVQGRALDLACGLGDNALFLAQQGLDTHAWDISDKAIERLSARAAAVQLPLSLQVRDVVENPPAPSSFDVIVVARFLERSLCQRLAQALKPGGILFYQTFVVGNQSGPSNPAYLLAEGELLQLFAGLSVRAFIDAGAGGDPARGLRDESCIVVQKSA